MSIQTYAPLENLPAPYTGAGFSPPFTDVEGEVWVAKAGVNGGAWAKAREALHAGVGRAAAFNITTTVTLFGWDTTLRDTYGLFVGNPTYGFVVPVAGWYRLEVDWSGAVSTLGGYLGTRIYDLSGGTNNMITNTNMISCVAGGQCTAKCQTLSWAFVGDTYTVQYWGDGSYTGAPGAYCRFFISYLGTG